MSERRVPWSSVTLRVLHTSDWHLGRALHEESLLEDQAFVLDRLVALAKDERPDVVVVAGDVYDRAVPPAEAVELLALPVVLVAGNHDSAERLSFGARLLAARGVHLRGALGRAAEPVELPGKGLVYAVPFVDPEVVRGLGDAGDDEIRGHAAATAWVLARVRADAARRDLPTVLVGHAFVQGAAQTPDSERPVVVGTAGSVPAETFAGFDYVALGHLHAPQALGPAMRYSGSLLKYSFSESGQEKGVVLAEVRRGGVEARTIALGARRDVVRLSGTLRDLLRREDLARHQGDLVEVTLEEDGYVLDAKVRLQARFAHVLNVLRKDLAAAPGHGTFGQQVAGAGRDDLKLFECFFETVTSALPGPEHRQVFVDALAEIERKERAA
jgi:DNA repair protein SbcD/Mre11